MHIECVPCWWYESKFRRYFDGIYRIILMTILRLPYDPCMDGSKENLNRAHSEIVVYQARKNLLLCIEYRGMLDIVRSNIYRSSLHGSHVLSQLFRYT